MVCPTHFPSLPLLHILLLPSAVVTSALGTPHFSNNWLLGGLCTEVRSHPIKCPSLLLLRPGSNVTSSWAPIDGAGCLFPCISKQPHTSIITFIAQHCNDLFVVLFSNKSVNLLRAKRHKCLVQFCIPCPNHSGWQSGAQ